jgi:uncharacterized protein (TIGR03086 family)
VSTPHGWAAPTPGPEAGAALLERAVGYTRLSLQLVPTTDRHARTPCEQWDLLELLGHMDDSLAAFTEAAEVGYVDLVPVRAGAPAGTHVELLLDRLRARACALVAAWADRPDRPRVAIGHDGAGLPGDLLAAAGALEIAVHGWDVAQACGVHRPLPAALALDLLDVAPLLIGDADRPLRFADVVDVPVHARPSTRLLAVTGRSAPR